MLSFLFVFIYRSFFALLLDFQFQSDVNLINKSILKLIIYIYIEHLRELVDSNFRLKNCNMQRNKFIILNYIPYISLPIIIERDAIERKKEAIIPKKISTRFHQHLFQHPTKLI